MLTLGRKGINKGRYFRTFTVLFNFPARVYLVLNPLTPRVSYGDIQVILTSGSVDEIL